MKKLIRRVISLFGDRFYNIFHYYYLHFSKGVFLPPKLNLKNPKTLNDKIIFLKMYYKLPDAKKYTDKLLVRNYVKDVLGPQYLIPIIGVWDSAEKIDFVSLPNRFVLKTNHGSGFNIICWDKTTLDIVSARKKLNKWLKTDYYKIGKEYNYKDIEPKIFAEKMLTDSFNEELRDYKVFCFNGKPGFIEVDIDRHSNHKRNFYDLDWNRIPFTSLYPEYDAVVEKPQLFDELIEASKILSKPFPFIRVDLYCSKGNIFFGVLTFNHEGGFGPVLPKKYNNILGDYLDLSTLNV